MQPKKFFFVFLVFFLLISSRTEKVLISDSGNLEALSNKNWFAKDFKIGPEKVTASDLRNSPNRDWLIYHGDYGANHYSPLSQINNKTAGSLVTKWTYKISEGGNLRSSPIVYDGIMYVTVSDEVHALDAKTGQWLWVWQAYGRRQNGINRGVAIYEDKILFSTSDCKLVALDKQTGDIRWFKQYADPGRKYFSTAAPLIVRDKVIIGVANNNDRERGFIAAFSILDGRELWRFWTLPSQSGLLGAPTWLTGSYDPESDTIYWPVGTLPDRQRTDAKLYDTPNAYQDSIVALDGATGNLRWAVKLAKYMPIDWDSNEPVVLVNNGDGKFIFQANRNGKFYVIDRSKGKIISEKPFIDRLNWNLRGSCPPVRGATNWMPPSYSSSTGLFYVMTLEGCAGEANQYYLKALEPSSGNIRWRYLTRGTNVTLPGVLSSGGNVVFSAEGSGHVVAIDAVNGKKLWDFSTGKTIFASPVTYLVDGRQYVTIVAGSDVFTFGLYSAQ